MKSEANKLLTGTVKKLLHRGGSAQIVKLVERTHPADLAYVFNRLVKQERRDFFTLIQDKETAADLLTELEPLVLDEFLQDLEPKSLVRLLEAMSSDDAADILASIEDEERRDLILTMMQREDLVTTQSLLEYDPESAGGLMVPEFFALREDTTAAQALRQLQEDAGKTEVVFYLYVVNEFEHLVGVTSLRELVMADAATPLRDIMITDAIRVGVDTDQEEVARLIARYNLIALPVVDGNNLLVGVVTVDDIIDVIRLEATEDMMLMAGAGDQQVDDLRESSFAAARARAPWLTPSFTGGVIALAMFHFASSSDASSSRMLLLVPLMMMMAGNVATQSAAIITRGLALERTNMLALSRVLVVELGAGIWIGVGWGALLFGILVAWLGVAGPDLRFAAGASAVFVLTAGVAAVVGASLPLLFARFKFDPAIATGPLVTSLVDVVTVGACVSIMTWLA